MPHSSGGGHGGHHGGSHHSGSHHSGGGGSSRRLGRQYFPGSRRYVRYVKGRPEYFYANFDPTAKPNPRRFLIGIFYVPFIFAIFMMCRGSFQQPSRITGYSDTTIVIFDDADYFTDAEEEKLMTSLEAFQNKTGITPVIHTVEYEVWSDSEHNSYQASNLEDYAFKFYVETFPDESHWLIVYSERGVKTDADWHYYFEGMQGNDTDPVLTTAVTNRFNAHLTNELQGNYLGAAGSIADSFDYITPDIMKRNIDFGPVFSAIFVSAFIIFHFCGMTGLIGGRKYYKNAVACSEDAAEMTCEYCGGVYVFGHAVCPHCGAIISNNKKETAEEHENGTFEGDYKSPFVPNSPSGKYDTKGEDSDYYSQYFGNNSSSNYDE